MYINKINGYNPMRYRCKCGEDFPNYETWFNEHTTHTGRCPKDSRCMICSEPVEPTKKLCAVCDMKYPLPQKVQAPVGSKFDPARHPTHYHEGKGIDPIGVMRETFTGAELEGFFKGSALKYIMRYQSKNGKQDLEKAKFYVEQLISLYTGRIPEDGNETK